MSVSDCKTALYRTASFLIHNLTAWNTGGEGIHSPYLFYLVRMLLYDSNAYYIWDKIEQQRQHLLLSKQQIEVTDYGTGRNRPALRSVSHIARTSLENPSVAQLLFRWVLFLGENISYDNTRKSLNILELGTNLGITTAYLATPDSRNNIFTMEGSESLCAEANKIWKRLGINNIKPVIGNIDDTLPTLLKDSPNWDLVFFDANHTFEATTHYWQLLKLHHHAKSIFVFDDIHASKEMYNAWRLIQHDPAVTSTFDLYYIGVVFFDNNYIRRHYRLRM